MVLGASVLSLALTSQIAPENAGPIQPDRPNYSNGTHILELGRTQFEFGYRQTHSTDATLNDYGDGFTVRKAVSKNLELRVGAPSYLNQVQGGSTVGFGDTNLGFKWKLSEAKSRTPSSGIVFTGIFRSGSDNFRENAFQPEVRGLFSFELPNDQSVDANIVVGVPSESGQHYTRYGASINYGKNLNLTTGVFAEVVEQLPGSYRGNNQSFFNTGLTKLVGQDLQLDAYVGHGISGAQDSGFFGLGASYRL